MSIPLDGIPLGHSIAAHLLLGLCSHCRGQTPGDEALAWRVWAGSNVPEVDRALSRKFGEPASKEEKS